MKDDKDSALAHGAGAGLLAFLGIFGRCADDVARIGVSSLDDVGRACIKSTDDIGSLMSRSGDDLVRSMDDVHAAKYFDDLRYEPSTPRVIMQESDQTVSISPQVTKDLAEVTFKIIDLNDNNNDK